MLNRFAADQERREFLLWLRDKAPDSIDKIHKKWSDTREKDTCKWLLEKDEWKSWFSAQTDKTPRFFWVNGIPGAGKTLLMSLVIDALKDHCGILDRTTVAYYYCHYTRAQDEGESFLRCILGQLCQKLDGVPNTIFKAFQDASTVDHTALLSTLEECLSRFDTVFVVLDAVDESNPRAVLFDVLKKLATEERFKKLRLVTSSRCEVDIVEALEPHSVEMKIASADNSSDIEKCIHSALQGQEYSWWTVELLDDVEKLLRYRANGMYA